MFIYAEKIKRAFFCFVFLANTSLWFPNTSIPSMEIALHLIGLHDQEYKLHSGGKLQGHNHSEKANHNSASDSKGETDQEHDNCHSICSQTTPLYVTNKFNNPLNILKPLIQFFSLIFYTSLNLPQSLFRPPILIFS